MKWLTNKRGLIWFISKCLMASSTIRLPVQQLSRILSFQILLLSLGYCYLIQPGSLFFISLQRYAGLGFLFIFPKVPLNLHFLEFISEEVLVLREWNFYLIPRLGVFIGSMQTFILQSVCFFLIVFNYCLLQRMMRIGWVKLLLFQYPKVRTRAAK